MDTEIVGHLFSLAKKSFKEFLSSTSDEEIRDLESELPSHFNMGNLIVENFKLSTIHFSKQYGTKQYLDVSLTLTLPDSSSFRGYFHIYCAPSTFEIFDDYLYWN